MKQVSNPIKENIIISLTQGSSTRDVAKQFKISQSTVVKYGKESVQNYPKRKSGRPGKISDQTKRYLAQKVSSNSFKTAVEARKYLIDELDINISTNRVREILHEKGLKGVIKKKKPFLSVKHQKARMEFVEKYEHWTDDDWERVIWSDETKINFFGSDGVRWGWKKNNNNLDPNGLIQTVKHGGGNIMIWGCMTWHGPGFISKIDGRLDAKLYVEIIDKCIPQTVEHYNINENEMIFQQDNDPKHTSKVAAKYFDDKKMNILYWPAQSPDLNPIEHLWVHVKRELAKFPEPPKGCNMLWQRVEDVFYSIPVEVCQNLIKSMSARIQAMKKAKGGHTKY